MLGLNDEKVEKTVMSRKEKREEEEWRLVKKLGILLGDSEEAKRRVHLAAAAFQKLKNIWSTTKQTKKSVPLGASDSTTSSQTRNFIGNVRRKILKLSSKRHAGNYYDTPSE